MLISVNMVVGFCLFDVFLLASLVASWSQRPYPIIPATDHPEAAVAWLCCN